MLFLDSCWLLWREFVLYIVCFILIEGILLLFFSIGENVKLLIDRPDGRYCFRLHKERVYYVSEKLLKHAAVIDGDNLISIGTCFGKFTKTRKFHLHVTALDYLAPYAQVSKDLAINIVTRCIELFWWILFSIWCVTIKLSMKLILPWICE